MTIVSEKSIVLPFPIISLWGKICAQGRITQKWIIRSSPNSNSFELLCLSSLPASLTQIQSKVTEKSRRHHFFHRSRARNSKKTRQIRPKFELVRDFMFVLVTCKFDGDWIHSNWEKMETPFSPTSVKLAGEPARPELKILPAGPAGTGQQDQPEHWIRTIAAVTALL